MRRFQISRVLRAWLNIFLGNLAVPLWNSVQLCLCVRASYASLWLCEEDSRNLSIPRSSMHARIQSWKCKVRFETVWRKFTDFITPKSNISIIQFQIEKKHEKDYAISAKLPSELLQLGSDSCHSNRLGFGNDLSASSFLFASVLQTISKLKTIFMPNGNNFYQMVFLLPQNISLALENGKSSKTPACLIQPSSPIVLMLPV